MDVFSTSKAPAAVGPYSQGTGAGSFVFCSGQAALVPETGRLVEGDIAAQTRQVMENLKAVLASASLSFDNVVKSTIFIVNMDDFATVNKVYGSYFSKNLPARSTVEVSRLPKETRVEIEMIAFRG
jgi:2-iminobutanoate/2-iminopropanoate deaminase